MLSLEQLIALHRTFAGEPVCPRVTAPTEASILHINRTLGIILPTSFIEFARHCPSYCSMLFASIGEDYDDDSHILSINHSFHRLGPPCVPAWMTVFNHGHDEDCDGFDSRQRSGDEYRIVYWDAAQGLKFDNLSWSAHTSFRDYLEFMITHYAKARDEKLAQQIIRAAQVAGTVGTVPSSLRLMRQAQFS